MGISPNGQLFLDDIHDLGKIDIQGANAVLGPATVAGKKVQTAV